ncbi:PSD1 and planctomycete cytochrome C domain-containing protein [Roseibacillus persicicus]|uniref:PSD1 and planctomycete cytochrome C domain-containing protein n=1 Tax=Roseibacillus persicicus TaxID=454148 RepID=UPI0027E563EA|nr:PSD1 and planctomycete cytochrome C domain-containing protein [Roseibacillus persicicus]
MIAKPLVFSIKGVTFRLTTTLSALGCWATISAEEDILQFNRDIRPIISEKCIACHGPDGKKREAGLRLDTQEGAFAPLKEGEGYAIVPGKPEDSVLLHRIDTTDEDEVMPPHHFHKEVTKEERKILEQWIREGAEYEAHWSYTPIVRPPVPAVEKHQELVRNPIDQFIFRRLEKEGVEPSPLADEATLVRRLSLDLTGLPPGPGAASDPEQVIEESLNSPAYGERMAVPWLDVVRFADTVGYHGDQNQRIFPYRDYVIQSFNDNKPFSQFVIEQIAGDLLPNPTEEQIVATGYNRLNLVTREGGAQPKEYIKKYAADRVRSIGTSFLGQTTGCAECHDHKYDPISAKDFYSLAAFFDDLQQWGVYQNYNRSTPDLNGFNNDHPFPPELVTRSSSLLERIQFLESQAVELLAQQGIPEEGEEKLIELKDFMEKHPDGWSVMETKAFQSSQNTPGKVLPDDQSILLTGSPRKDDVLSVELQPKGRNLGSIRLEALPDAANAGHVGRDASGRFSLSPSFELLVPGEDARPLKVRFAQADLDRPAKYANGDRRSLSFDGTWFSAPARFELPSDLTRKKATAVFCLEQAIEIPAGAIVRAKIASADIGRMRFSLSPRLDPVPGHDAFSPQFRAALESSQENAAFHLCFTPPAKLGAGYGNVLAGIRDARGGWTRTVVSNSIDKPAYPSRVLNRGDWQDESGELVEPAVLSFLPSDSLPSDRRLTRLDLANWIVADENPLTARHFVNRLWKQFFGSGLSNVLDDLGGQGEPPSHPDLLDWLAAEFRDSGWNVKHMVRLITESHTYRQAAAHREDLLEKDPYNRLLAQQGGRRLDAEFVRDNALSVAGLLEQRLVGGPSVFPYQPAGYYEPLNFPTRKYRASGSFQQHRRSVYAHWQRTFLHPTMASFDAPARDECAADRPMANSPQQALALLNDPIFVEAAQALGEVVTRELPEGSDQQRIEFLFQRVLNRAPDEVELASFGKVLDSIREGESELSPWFQVSRLILNLHETITRY